MLVAIREDALAKLEAFERQIPEVLNNTLPLKHLDLASAEDAIRKPLDHYNELVPAGRTVDIDNALVPALLNQVRTGRVQVDSSHGSATTGISDEDAHPAEVRVEAPFLQLVLTRLWDEESQSGSRLLRLSTLQRLGGAQEIVRQHLDRVMREFTPPEMAVLADAFGHLVTRSGSKIAHYASDLADSSNATRPGGTLAAEARREGSAGPA